MSSSTSLEQAPPSPDYVPGPEHPPSPEYVSGPEYQKYVAPSDDEIPVEDQPLPDDLEDDLKEDPAHYPTDGGDDEKEEEESFEDDDDEEDEEEASEED
ncbi:hypothetical protein Tco_1281322 [Tanacetum coccineum]